MKATFAMLLFVLIPATAAGQDYCSLLVNAVDPSGQEVAQAKVTVEEQNGRVVTGEYRPGGLRFCDLGIKPVTITVGSGMCNQVTVRNVGLGWGHTTVVKLIYDDEPCRRDLPVIPACEILFRFVDEKGSWISGVSLRPAVELSRPPSSDTHGRLVLNILAGEQIASVAEKPGYVPEEIRLTCSRELMHEERLIVLRSK